MTIDEVTDIISKLTDYIELYIQDERIRTNAVNRLEEAVFWITYGNDSQE